MPPKRATRKQKGVVEEEKMDKGGSKQSTASHSPAFNTRRRVRGCTMMDSPSSTSKNSSSVVGLTSSVRLSKKSKYTTEEPLKSESQEADRNYPRFHSSQLNDAIDKIPGGKYSQVSQPPGNASASASPSRLIPAKRGEKIEICSSVTPRETALKTIPTTKAYMDNQKPPRTTPVPSMTTDAEQIPLEEAMAASDFVKETERDKEFDVDATCQNNNNLDQTGQAPVDYMTAVAEQTPLEEAMLASYFTEARPQGSSSSDSPMKDNLSQTHSLNLTKMAAMCDDDDSSRDEVGSHPSLVAVRGYRVKEASAPLLEAIFLKYGDIAAHCSLVSIEGRSRFLEDVCDILRTLQETDFVRITQEEIQSKVDYVCDLAYVNMEVGWLHQRLTDILEAKQLVKQSSTLKAVKDKNTEFIDEQKRKLKCYNLDMRALEEKISSTEAVLAAAEVEAGRINEKHCVAKGKVRILYNRSLADDLV
ncbi:Phospholipase-like [Trema orientale]|uniref:Phospholipase-like n=1 Tax=Trema orientale TaxID=63057 RepID=A0A2P5FP50_TREOI|nr:Phospholipase-like [Trema orientale]